MRGSQNQEDGDVHPYVRVGESWVEGFTQWLSENPEKVAEVVESMRRPNRFLEAVMAGRSRFVHSEVYVHEITLGPI